MSWITDFRSALATRREEFVELLKECVCMESPSGDVARLNALSSRIADRWGTLADMHIARVPNQEAGDHLLIRWYPPHVDPQRKPWLVIGHFDTVWPTGTLERMPFRLDDDVVFGPGTYDMKSALVMAWITVREMQSLGVAPSRPAQFLWTSDEEVGSRSSRSLIEAHARGAYAALILEPPLADGGAKTSRKGVGMFRLDVAGRSAHAGIEPEKGRSAIVELAHQILKVQSIARPECGTTLTVGQAGGGTANNVVPDTAWATIDARVSSMEEAARLAAEIPSTLTPVTADVQVTVTGGLNRPPMERSEGTAQLFHAAREIAALLGVSLKEGGTGGGSDGNFTAAVGCPTLDGLGMEGAGAHAPHEQISLTSLPFRGAMLAGMLTSKALISEDSEDQDR